MKRNLLIIICSLIGALVPFFIFNFAKAEEAPKIYFSEIMGEGSSASAVDKWIELYNASDETVDLAGWVFINEMKDGDSGRVPISEGLIAPHGHFLIAHNAKDKVYSNGESVLNIDPDVVDTNVSWNKENFKISLRSQEDKTIDEAGNGGELLKGKNWNPKRSIKRRDYLVSGGLEEAWELSAEGSWKYLDPGATELATPENSGRPKIEFFELAKSNFPKGQKINLEINYKVTDSFDDLQKMKLRILNDNFVVADMEKIFGEKIFSLGSFDFCPRFEIEFIDDTGLWAKKAFEIICFQKSNDVKFYEILPHPKNIDWNSDGKMNIDDEWIELVNFSKGMVSLEGWKIMDKSGKTYVLPKISISPESFIALYKSQTSITLNDTGDILTLLDPEGNIADSVGFGSSSSKLDISYAKWGDSWEWTETPTPGAINNIVQIKPAKDPTPEVIEDETGLEVEITAEVKEIERDSIVVVYQGKNIIVKIIDGVSAVAVGDKIKIKGRSYGGSFPYILARAVDIAKLTEESNSAESVVSANDAASAPLENSKIVIVKRSYSNKIKELNSNLALKPVVLGEAADKYNKGFISVALLLYFYGAMVLMAIVLVYDISSG